MPQETFIDVGHVVRHVEYPYVLAELTDNTPVKLGLRPVRIENILDKIKVTVVRSPEDRQVLSTATFDGSYEVVIDESYISELPSQVITMHAMFFHESGVDEFYRDIKLEIPTELDTETNPKGLYVKKLNGVGRCASNVDTWTDGFVPSLMTPTVDFTMSSFNFDVYTYNPSTGISTKVTDFVLSNNTIGVNLGTEQSTITHDTTNFSKPYYAQEVSITAGIDGTSVEYKMPVSPRFNMDGVQSSFLELADDVPDGTLADPWILPDVTAIELRSIIENYFNCVWLGSGVSVIHDEAQHPKVMVSKFENKVRVGFGIVDDAIYTHLHYPLSYLGERQMEFNVTWTQEGTP